MPTTETIAMNNMPQLPDAFVQQLLPILREESGAFFASYLNDPLRGIRFRGERIPLPASELTGKIPYAKNAYYLAPDSKAGMLPFHDAGAYYIQEPSAMAAAAVLQPQAGDRVLDLCAAPGGKSTQLAMSASLGLLVANEPIPSRAQILSGNIERMGIRNAVVTAAYPQQLAEKWPRFFDRILVDAPCSGEGMFRRHPETIAEWSADAPEICHHRQVEILDAAAKMLRAGGYMVYSTCTFNWTENEQSVSSFLQTHPNFRLSPFAIHGLPPSTDGTLRLWPHKFPGEGHFVALLHKEDVLPEERDACLLNEPVFAPDKQSAAVFSAFAKEMGADITANMQRGNRLFAMPAAMPPLSGIKTLRTGLHLAELRGKNLFPDHAFALSVAMSKKWAIHPDLAAAYLHGDTLNCPESLRGYYAIDYCGFQLGFGKASNGQMKNHYPKGLRY